MPASTAHVEEYPNSFPNDSEQSYPNARSPGPNFGNSHTQNQDQLLDFLNAQTVDRLEEQEKPKIIESSRSARLKFEIPKTPSRQSAPLIHERSVEEAPKRRWSSPGLRNKKQPSISEDAIVIEVGSRVELIGRPLETLGKVRYIGLVDFSPGEWFGVALDERGTYLARGMSQNILFSIIFIIAINTSFSWSSQWNC
jgi:CAP-Gly domain